MPARCISGKQPKTLSGIETKHYGNSREALKCGKQPKTLSGIETMWCANPKKSKNIKNAENNLKPYQGLKLSLIAAIAVAAARKTT